MPVVCTLKYRASHYSLAKPWWATSLSVICAACQKVASPPVKVLAHFGQDWPHFSNLSCWQVKLMAIIIGLHCNVCCALRHRTGYFYEQPVLLSANFCPYTTHCICVMVSSVTFPSISMHFFFFFFFCKIYIRFIRIVQKSINQDYQTAQNFELFFFFWQKIGVFYNHFWQRVDAILEDVSVAEIIV